MVSEFFSFMRKLSSFIEINPQVHALNTNQWFEIFIDFVDATHRDVHVFQILRDEDGCHSNNHDGHSTKKESQWRELQKKFADAILAFQVDFLFDL